MHWAQATRKSPRYDWDDIVEDMKRGCRYNFDAMIYPKRLGVRASNKDVIAVTIAEQVWHTAQALEELLDSLTVDRVVGIDLEWVPDCFNPHNNSRIASLQLASSTYCVVVRLNQMQGFPNCLKNVLKRTDIVLVGCGWNSRDEHKLTSEFGLGRRDFRCFFDIQEIAKELKYAGTGLKFLARTILSAEKPNVDYTDMAGFADFWLRGDLLLYAALDPLLTVHVFKRLCNWWSQDKQCPQCHRYLALPLDENCRGPGVCPCCKRHWY